LVVVLELVDVDHLLGGVIRVRRGPQILLLLNLLLLLGTFSV
jgi:hypothetical protein